MIHLANWVHNMVARIEENTKKMNISILYNAEKQKHFIGTEKSSV